MDGSRTILLFPPSSAGLGQEVEAAQMGRSPPLPVSHGGSTWFDLPHLRFLSRPSPAEWLSRAKTHFLRSRPIRHRRCFIAGLLATQQDERGYDSMNFTFLSSPRQPRRIEPRPRPLIKCSHALFASAHRFHPAFSTDQTATFTLASFAGRLPHCSHCHRAGHKIKPPPPLAFRPQEFLPGHVKVTNTTETLFRYCRWSSPSRPRRM